MRIRDRGPRFRTSAEARGSCPVWGCPDARAEVGGYLAAVHQSESWWDLAFLNGDIVALIPAPDTGLVTAFRYRIAGLDL